jgi:hypothetical protein
MLKKTITYTDFNDVEKTEDFFFNLTKAELMKLELGIEGGLGEYTKKLIAEKNISDLISLMEKIVITSYGEKTEDGKNFVFVKNPMMQEAFMQTDAYSNLFMELITDEQAGAAFINGVMPHDMKMDDIQMAKATEEAKQLLGE